MCLYREAFVSLRVARGRGVLDMRFLFATVTFLAALSIQESFSAITGIATTSVNLEISSKGITPSLNATETPPITTENASYVEQERGPFKQEISLLLDELRQVATAINEVRKDHGRLAKGVAEISAAVRDMNERNLHIKKKVRKISKALNKSTHHHKVKDGFRSLQKDHEKILSVMAKSFFNFTGNPNFTAFFHHRRNHNNETTTEKTTVENSEKSLKNTSDSNIANPEVESSKSSPIDDLVIEPPEQVFLTKKEKTLDEKKPDLSLPLDCTDVLYAGNVTSGIYIIQPKGMKPFSVWCDQDTNGGGWTVIIARHPQEKQLDFARTWEEYKNGFGDPTGEYWIGTEAMHRMSKRKRHELRVNITTWSDESVWSEWKEFSVAAEDKGYKLKIGRYSSSLSTAGDALKWHNSMKFSTVDMDNDVLLGGHCARKNSGGWWYRGHRGCFHAHPTGKFQYKPSDPPATKEKNFEIGGVLAWQNWRGISYFPKTLFLMFRPYTQ